MWLRGASRRTLLCARTIYCTSLVFVPYIFFRNVNKTPSDRLDHPSNKRFWRRTCLVVLATHTLTGGEQSQDVQDTCPQGGPYSTAATFPLYTHLPHESCCVIY